MNIGLAKVILVVALVNPSVVDLDPGLRIRARVTEQARLAVVVAIGVIVRDGADTVFQVLVQPHAVPRLVRAASWLEVGVIRAELIVFVVP